MDRKNDDAREPHGDDARHTHGDDARHTHGDDARHTHDTGPLMPGTGVPEGQREGWFADEIPDWPGPPPAGHRVWVPLALESEVEQVLRQAEDTVTELREVLAEQRRRRQEHEEIERAEEHLAESRVRWAEIRAFFTEVRREIRGRRDPGAGPHD